MSSIVFYLGSYVYIQKKKVAERGRSTIEMGRHALLCPFNQNPVPIERPDCFHCICRRISAVTGSLVLALWLRGPDIALI